MGTALPPTVVQLGIVVLTIGGLWLGARLLVDTVIRLARRLGLSELTIGLTVVAAGTSAPELVVSVDAALAGLGAIAVGNVVGSNVYNLAFILGVVSLVRVVPIERSLVHRDGVVLVASTLLGGAVLFDGVVSRLEGALLVGLFVAYTGYLLRTTTETPTASTSTSESASTATTTSEPSSVDASGSADVGADDAATNPPNAVSTALTERVDFRGRDALLLVVGLGVVLVCGDLLVGAASALARGAGVSDLVIGSTIVAAGTSTPEFAVSLVAMRRGRLGVSVGNVVGSNVFNVLGIMGLSAVIRPLSVGPDVLQTVAWLTVVSVLMVAALWTGRQLSRVEGGLFATSEVARWILGLVG
ncbi:sodium:calcium antiporter [Salinigranum salinum]|uniref:sodium:calcium antiporter n=1 Tax=Salinigranum salinum TaxID=1364937 RepID=UPI001261054F|nr:sodium:calcium antiporter [Salinigranum salinum]